MHKCNVKPEYIAGFGRFGASTIEGLMSLQGGKLSLEPPDSACLKALLQQVATQSAALNMPLEDGSNHAVRGDVNSAATKAAYARLEGNMMTVCRAAKIALPAIIQEVATSAASSASPEAARLAKEKKDREADEAELKDAATKASALRADAKQTYNVSLGTYRQQRRATVEQLVKTHQAFKRHTLSVAATTSAKYGHVNAVEKSATTLTVGASGSSLIAVEDSEQLNRISDTLQAINAVLDSMVEAGLVPINPSVATLAGDFGKLHDGRQVPAAASLHVHQLMQICPAPHRCNSTCRPRSPARRATWRCATLCLRAS